MALRTILVDSHKALGRFILLPWNIYKGSSCWVPPLVREVRHKLDGGFNPFFEYGRVQLFGVEDDKSKLVGRIAAIHNPRHFEIHRERVGFFGFFESVNNAQVAQLLFDAARDWLRTCGCTAMVGPVNLNTNDETGFLLEGFQERPSFMTNYCPPYYHQLADGCGLRKAIDTVAYEAQVGHVFPEKLNRVQRTVHLNPAVSVQSFHKKSLYDETRAIYEIYNKSFQETWGFVPLTFAEALALAQSFLPFADFELIWIARYKGKAVGFILGLPDLNEILADLNGRLYPFGVFKFLVKRNHISKMRVLAFGVLPEYRSLGIESLLIEKVHHRIVNKIYRKAEFSVVMENNVQVRRLLEHLGFRQNKRYRIYRTEL